MSVAWFLEGGRFAYVIYRGNEIVESGIATDEQSEEIARLLMDYP